MYACCIAQAMRLNKMNWHLGLIPFSENTGVLFTFFIVAGPIAIGSVFLMIILHSMASSFEQEDTYLNKQIKDLKIKLNKRFRNITESYASGYSSAYGISVVLYFLASFPIHFIPWVGMGEEASSDESGGVANVFLCIFTALLAGGIGFIVLIVTSLGNSKKLKEKHETLRKLKLELKNK